MRELRYVKHIHMVYMVIPQVCLSLNLNSTRTQEVLMSTGRFIPGTHSMASLFPRGMVIISGNSHKNLAEDVARSEIN